MVRFMYLTQATYKRIEQLCDEHKIKSINKLCNNAGVAQSTVFNLASGKTENPRFIIAIKNL